MSWSVGRYRVEYEPPSGGGGFGALIVDHHERVRFVPEMTLELGKVDAQIRVAMDYGVLRPELSIGQVRVPVSPEWAEQRKAKEGALCAGHGSSTAAYRSTGRTVDAKYECPVCKRSLCIQCMAIDRVLCASCFGGALEEEAWLRLAHRRGRAMRVASAAIATSLLASFAGYSWGNLGLAGGGLLFAALGVGYLILELRRRRPSRRPWSPEVPPPALPRDAVMAANWEPMDR